MAVFSINEISLTDNTRWFAVSNASGEANLFVFGYVGPINETELVSGQPNLNAFLTEDALETWVNTDTGNPDYYKNAVETSSLKFQGPSGKYEPINEEPNE